MMVSRDWTKGKIPRPLKRALILIINRDPRLESLGYFQSSADADEVFAKAPKARNVKA